MPMRDKRSLPLLALAFAVAATAGAQAGDELPSLRTDIGQASVSGLSSGAYMAGQFHVAFSGSLVGAAVVAGGPYDCAEGSLVAALNRCMETARGVPDPRRLLDRARERATQGAIDPLAEMASDRVYVFSGTNDRTVTPPVVATVPDFYRQAGLPDAQIAVVDDMPAGHAFITETTGNPCGETRTPYINDCDYDQAGELLAHIYGPLAPPADAVSGALLSFGQTEFLTDPVRHGMATTGYAYVPDDCATAPGCRVHVAFHGCRQNAAAVGDAFFRGAGYNRWADTNRIIVLYPQTSATSANPNACWDWWGHDDPAYATQDGRQMAAIRAMLERLAGIGEPEEHHCDRFAASNLGHWQAGRARICDWWFLCAVGSGERLGLPLSSTTLFEHPKENFSTAACG
jgi:poly(3-hydroxybutyrate) depolymerase